MFIPAKKSLGQNFLKDENILSNISNAVDVLQNDFIIEIGPGKGALTKYLVLKGCNYLGYEIDKRMKPILFQYTSQIIYDDFLKRDLISDLAQFSFHDIYVVANIPYYITTPIIEHLIESQVPIKKMVLLVQKEVAERFCAKPGSKDYGYFTVYLNYYFHVTKLFDVSKFCFEPVPNVTSSVVCFESKEVSFHSDDKEYFMFLKKCFANKRKTLKNNLKEYDWNAILSVLNQYQLSEHVRAEEIAPELFQEIYLKVSK